MWPTKIAFWIISVIDILYFGLVISIIIFLTKSNVSFLKIASKSSRTALLCAVNKVIWRHWWALAKIKPAGVWWEPDRWVEELGPGCPLPSWESWAGHAGTHFATCFTGSDEWQWKGRFFWMCPRLCVHVMGPHSIVQDVPSAPASSPSQAPSLGQGNKMWVTPHTSSPRDRGSQPVSQLTPCPSSSPQSTPSSQHGSSRSPKALVKPWSRWAFCLLSPCVHSTDRAPTNIQGTNPRHKIFSSYPSRFQPSALVPKHVPIQNAFSVMHPIFHTWERRLSLALPTQAPLISNPCSLPQNELTHCHYFLSSFSCYFKSGTCLE